MIEFTINLKTMNRTNVIITSLLVIAVVLGLINLKIYSDLRAQNSRIGADGVQLPAPADEVKNASGTLVSLSGSSLVANIAGKNLTLAFGNDMKYYRREIMSDSRYQRELKAAQAPQQPKRIAGDATGGVYEIPMAPVQDVFRQVKTIGELHLVAGDNINVAYMGTLANGKTIMQVIKVVHL